ncbi:MAG: hypothetical protein JO134_06000 [Xanthobacteraceae bacterium]|nr:hypothetical protein [Xanthobacteraceae bacterium]
MRRLRIAALAASCGTVVLTPLLISAFADPGSPHLQAAAAAPAGDYRPASALPTPEPVNAAQIPAISKISVADASPAIHADSVVEPVPVEPPATAVALAAPDNPQTAAGELTTASAPDAMQDGAAEPTQALTDPCAGAETCIDDYLWSLYERAPKVDTVKETEKKKVTVEKNGKSHTITKTETKLVAENFAWKDPQAAEKAGMPVKEYVIGGMDHGFKHRLYRTLRALDRAGLVPGITSAFRDDYRQSLASGLHAASNRSYHGGSLRGGYGHGLAADVVSVKGDTSAERWAASEQLWKWIDAHGKDLGIGRPYLNKDPGHCAPVDGKEYADHHAKALAQQTHPDAKKKSKVAKHDHTKEASTTLAASREPQGR